MVQKNVNADVLQMALGFRVVLEPLEKVPLSSDNFKHFVLYILFYKLEVPSIAPYLLVLLYLKVQNYFLRRILKSLLDAKVCQMRFKWVCEFCDIVMCVEKETLRHFMHFISNHVFPLYLLGYILKNTLPPLNTKIMFFQ